MPNRNLSYTNLFNQQKIIINDSQLVSVPATGVLTTLLTIATTETVTPTARVFMEFNGRMAPIASSGATTSTIFGKDGAYYAFFNSLNSLVIQVVSFDAYSPRIYYRIYKDGRPQ